ncbi:MAG TPA: hypothetical protein DCY53_05095 [Desulfobacteraceae bacterium]|nr:hypothetical protein [Desulfobacteraceae bacterium]
MNASLLLFNKDAVHPDYDQYEKDPWSVKVSKGQIEQVLLNLYVNAWQAMSGGGDLYVEINNILLLI